jgi:ferredoxin
MKLRIDQEKCVGHLRCWAVSPQLIEPDDDGYGTVIDPEISADAQEAAELAALACPEQAVHLEP